MEDAGCAKLGRGCPGPKLRAGRRRKSGMGVEPSRFTADCHLLERRGPMSGTACGDGHAAARAIATKVGEPVGSRTLLNRLKGGCFAAKASSSKIGSRGWNRTNTDSALDAVPLPIGLRDRYPKWHPWPDLHRLGLA